MSRRSDIRGKLAELGIAPKKSHGQNFLFDPGGISKVIQFAAVQARDCVCEIGPGLGAISRPLAESAARYVAIEIEPEFAENLRQELADIASAEVITSDVRKVSLAALGGEDSSWKIVSNVPYSVSSEVVLWLLEQRRCLSQATLLFQREFAERVAAVPGTKEYGSLSVQTQLVADVRLGPRLPGGAFFPPTSVESRLVELRFLPEPRYLLLDPELFRRVVRAGFGQRRKTLLNALASGGIFADKDEGEMRLSGLGITPTRRAETLTVEEFVRISNALAS